MEPFLLGGSETVRLFTTRIRGIPPRSVEPVRVDKMDWNEAIQLLTAGAYGVPDDVVAGLLSVIGRWPVLLALVNGVVRADLNVGRGAEDSMRKILYELRTTGPTALDVTDATERHTAVARTIEVSLRRLTTEQRDRYLELAVFGEDVAIPSAVLAWYWQATGGWSRRPGRLGREILAWRQRSRPRCQRRTVLGRDNQVEPLNNFKAPPAAGAAP